MINNNTNDFTAMLKGLSPDEARGLLKRLKAEAIEAAKKAREQKEEKRAKRADPKKQKEFFKKYDEQVGELPDGFQKVRDRIIALSDWEPGMGNCELHFSKKPLGSQCLWAANWQTSQGILSPGSYFPLERMTSAELLVEGKDAIHPGPRFAGIRQPDPKVIEKLIVPIMEKYENGGIHFLDDLKKALTKIRGAYCEYIFPFDPPAHSFQVLVRPGWGSQAEITAAMEKLRLEQKPKR